MRADAPLRIKFTPAARRTLNFRDCPAQKRRAPFSPAPRSAAARGGGREPLKKNLSRAGFPQNGVIAALFAPVRLM